MNNYILLLNKQWDNQIARVRYCITTGYISLEQYFVCSPHRKIAYLKRKTFYKNQRKNRGIWFKQLKEEQGCAICGYNKCGDALVYHHIEKKLKKKQIAAMILYIGSKSILEEINKCILVCKNCHAEIHYRERNYEIKEVNKNASI